MPPVYLDTQDGIKFKVIRDRTFEDYSKAFGFIAGRRLEDILLDKAQKKSPVHFYDIGCGEAGVTTDMDAVLAEKAEKRGLSRELAKRIVYVGIDAYHGDYWVNSNSTKFYEGDILETLRGSSLPPIDVGVSHEVFPYLDHKLEVIEALANMLSIGEERGILLVTPFYEEQLILPGQSGNRFISMHQAFGDSLDVVHEQNNRLVLTPNLQGDRVRSRLEFLDADYEFWQFSKGDIIGRPGQRISYYTEIIQKLLN